MTIRWTVGCLWQASASFTDDTRIPQQASELGCWHDGLLVLWSECPAWLRWTTRRARTGRNCGALQDTRLSEETSTCGVTAFIGPSAPCAYRASLGPPSGFLGPILMHSGIPTYCLKDLLRMLVEHSRRDPGLDADSFIQWAAGGPSRMRTLDKPMQHLIEDGGEFAYDIIDRLLTLWTGFESRDRTSLALGCRSGSSPRPAASRTMGSSAASQGQRRTTHRSGVDRPRLALDPFGEGPADPAAPPPGMHGDSLWTASRTTSGLHAAGLGRQSRISFPLSGPAHHVQVVRLPETATTVISVVRDDDPLLVFNEDGESLPPGRPSRRTWSGSLPGEP